MLKMTYSSVFQINFVAYNYKGEVLWVSGGSLNEELVSPTIQGAEGVGHGHIKD